MTCPDLASILMFAGSFAEAEQLFRAGRWLMREKSSDSLSSSDCYSKTSSELPILFMLDLSQSVPFV